MRNFKLEMEFTPRKFADMLVGAIECNHMTRAWCSGVYWKDEESDPPTGKGPWYDNERLFGGDFTILVVEDYDERHDHFVTRKDVEEGLKIMARDAPRHFADMMSENGDNVTQDVFLQCVALKKIVYG